MSPEISSQVDETKNTEVALIVAHPDDETLWAGGTILSHPAWNCFVVCLSRKNDANRAPKFFEALRNLRCEGVMGDLDDGPEQVPVNESELQSLILELLPRRNFGLIITHHPSGEYTRHRRHEEIGKAVIGLWHAGKIVTEKLWTFAYEDGNRSYYPRAMENATTCRILSPDKWLEKYSIITTIYGFGKNSWEAEVTPRTEAFVEFGNPLHAYAWCNNLNP